ncbi:MAG: hypothetical protein OHK0046_05300 [Anaerolineae bacterium]
MSEQVDAASELRFVVDPEPPVFRVVLLAVLLIGFVLGYGITYSLFSLNTCNLVGVFAGFALGAVLLQITERFLKPYFKSGKTVHLSFSEFDLRIQNDSMWTVNPMDEFEIVRWRFTVPRRTRVPKGWYVVALAFTQEDVVLPVYTLVSPEDFETLPQHEGFIRLKSQKEQEAEGDNLRLGGQQRRLMMAESARNLQGVEMAAEDFRTMLLWLEQHYARRLI